MNINRNLDSDLWLNEEDVKTINADARRYRNYVPQPGDWAFNIIPDPFLVVNN